jgi:hypothetical protein
MGTTLVNQAKVVRNDRFEGGNRHRMTLIWRGRYTVEFILRQFHSLKVREVARMSMLSGGKPSSAMVILSDHSRPHKAHQTKKIMRIVETVLRDEEFIVVTVHVPGVDVGQRGGGGQ